MGSSPRSPQRSLGVGVGQPAFVKLLASSFAGEYGQDIAALAGAEIEDQGCVGGDAVPGRAPLQFADQTGLPHARVAPEDDEAAPVWSTAGPRRVPQCG